MSTGAAIREGFRLARRNRRAVWVLLLVNLGLAALAALPIYNGILLFTGHSLVSQALASGFSTDWLTDFSFNNHRTLDRYAMVIALIGLISIPVNSILAGGVLARFREPERAYTLGDFFRNTARYSGRLLWLALIGLIFYWILFRVLNQFLRHVLDYWTRDWLDDRPVFLLHLGRTIFLLLGLAFVNLVMDFARVKVVMHEGTGAAEGFLVALGFSLGRLGKAVAVYAVPSLCGLALLGVYRLVVPWSAIDASLGSTSHYREPLVLALLFLSQQLVMFGRYWFRVATWASEWSYFRHT